MSPKKEERELRPEVTVAISRIGKANVNEHPIFFKADEDLLTKRNQLPITEESDSDSYDDDAKREFEFLEYQFEHYLKGFKGGIDENEKI